MYLQRCEKQLNFLASLLIMYSYQYKTWTFFIPKLFIPAKFSHCLILNTKMTANSGSKQLEVHLASKSLHYNISVLAWERVFCFHLKIQTCELAFGLQYLEQDSRSRLCCSTEGAGLMLGVAQRDVLKSHWSSSFSSSCSVGPPTSADRSHHFTTLSNRLFIFLVLSTVIIRPGSRLALPSLLLTMSMAVLRSHIWMLPFAWPVKRYRRGLEPIRLEPSHSRTVKHVMVVPSTACTSQILKYRYKNYRNVRYLLLCSTTQSHTGLE